MDVRRRAHLSDKPTLDWDGLQRPPRHSLRLPEFESRPPLWVHLLEGRRRRLAHLDLLPVGSMPATQPAYSLSATCTGPAICTYTTSPNHCACPPFAGSYWVCGLGYIWPAFWITPEFMT